MICHLKTFKYICIATKLTIAFVSLFLTFSLNLSAQTEDEEVTQQVWLDYNIKYDFANKFAVYADMGGRIISPYVWTRYYLRPAVSYTRSPFTDSGRKLTTTWHFGVGIFYTNNVEIPDHTELRPFQGYNVQWPNFKRFRISHYFRLEERFEFTDSTSDFGMRARYMLNGTLRFNKEGWKTMNNFYFPFHIELFFNLAQTSQFNDLIRITPGLGYHFNASWRLEFNLSYHRTRNTVEENFETNDLVFRLRIYQDIL